MPVGEVLIEEVAQTLSVLDPKTVVQVHGSLPDHHLVSKRAVRYALDALIKDGRAKRLGRRGQHYKVLAVVR